MRSTVDVCVEIMASIGQIVADMGGVLLGQPVRRRPIYRDRATFRVVERRGTQRSSWYYPSLVDPDHLGVGSRQGWPSLTETEIEALVKDELRLKHGKLAPDRQKPAD